jgi:hypothetical protein
VAVSEEKKKSRWIWPWGLLATGLAGAGVVLFRGCWHSKMCGIKRLFDEKDFRAYGPYSYDLNRLITWDQARKSKSRPVPDSEQHRTAS